MTAYEFVRNGAGRLKEIILENKKIVLILLIALIPRVLLSAWRISTGGNTIYLSQYETYNDFQVYYMWWVKDIGLGLLPYKDFGYLYPPLFAYTLYLFSFLNASFFPIIATDAASASLIYLIVKQNTGKENLSVISGLVYAFSPFFLIYEGYVWFSEQPMFFFILLSLYLAGRKKIALSGITFAVAILFKQEALLVAPALLYFLVRGNGLRNTMRFVSASAISVLAVSAPFLLTIPNDYLGWISFGKLASASTLVSSPPGNLTSSVLPMQCSSSLVSQYVTEACSSSGTNVFNATISPPMFGYGFIVATNFALCALMVLPLVFMRKDNNQLEFLSGVSLLCFMVLLIGLQTLPTYRYYMLPFYGIMLASIKDKWWLVAATVFPALSLLIPPGLFQVGPPVYEALAIFFIWFYQNRNRIGELIFISNKSPW